eukprot:6135887-Alexandrium_andersonii.AAC.1
MKNLLGVRDGGSLAARYRDFAVSRRQPRIITANSTPEEWLDKITYSDVDRLAIRKRVIMFTVKESVIQEAAVDLRDGELDEEVNEGLQRLAAKLG